MTADTDVEQGAYVQAWVWVRLDEADKGDDCEPSDEKYRELAQDQWHREGEIEIDDNAVVSR